MYYKFWPFSNMVFTYSLFSWRISLLVLFPSWHRIWIMSHLKSNFWKTRLATHERCWRPSGNIRFSINYLQRIKQDFFCEKCMFPKMLYLIHRLIYEKKDGFKESGRSIRQNSEGMLHGAFYKLYNRLKEDPNKFCNYFLTSDT